MSHRLHSCLSTLTLLGVLLSACAPTAPTAGSQKTATPEEVTVTPTSLPPAPTGLPPTHTATFWPAALTYEDALPLFKYDPAAPFDVKVASEKTQGAAIVQDLTYQAADAGFTQKTGGRILAYLVKPAGNGPFAGVVFMHGLGAGWGNRNEFLDEAVSLAGQGVVSLLPAGLFPWLVSFTGVPQTDQVDVIKQVIELRRSLDFLLAQPGVDAGRIAFVGHDYGAMHGAVLSGVDKRIRAYVLMAGDSDYSNWDFQYFARPADQETYRKIMAAVDPVSYLPHASPAALFLQFGGSDGFVSEAASNRQVDAAGPSAKVGRYPDAPHTLNGQAAQDRLAWLAAELNLPPAP